MTADIGLTMKGLAETVVVKAQAVDLETSSAEAQLIERRQAPVITDNIGSQEMKDNGDRDAAAAMERVTGVSVVENSYVFVRGLGERYSNTTLAGSVLPTTEPDKKVVPLDMFPTGLIDSVQVSKSYSPDKSAEFAGGLVQIIPIKLPSATSLRPQLRNRLLHERNRQRHSAQPAREPRRLGVRQRRAGAAIGDPVDEDRAAGHLHAGRRLLQQPDHRIREDVREHLAAGQDRRPSPGRAGARPSVIGSTISASSPASPSPTRSNSSRRIGASSVSVTPGRSKRRATTTC